ncbi:MAG: InlB B-repeat-containing protein [Chitinispirillaceae bacterium]|nr:InlB B-repeat-containing protein [Chitinispirillaceae bacterium]
MKRLLFFIVSFSFLFICEPLPSYYDPDSPDFLQPNFTVDLEGSEFWDGDTVSADTVHLSLQGNQISRETSLFRQLLDDGEWSDWQEVTSGMYEIEFSDLAEGLHTLTIAVCYDPEAKVTDSTITFYKAVTPSVAIVNETDLSFEVGAPCTLQVTAAGTGNLVYSWYHDSVLIDSATGDMLVLDNVTAAEAGEYYCRITNTWGETVSPEVHVSVLYRIVYNGNGNTGGEAPVDTNIYDSEALATLLENNGNLTRRGYTFGGWNQTTDGSGDTLDSEIGFASQTENVTLYAEWIPNPSHTLQFDANGATWEDTTETELSYRSGELITIPGTGEILSNEGYTFIGWNTEPDGSGTTYGQNDLLEMGDRDITLYAQWTSNPTVTVIYDANNADGGEVPVDAKHYREGDVVTVAGNSGALVREGYSFIGWTAAAEGGTGYSPGATFVMAGENITLYARWTSSPIVTITYRGNGNTGGVEPEPVSGESGSEVTVAGPGILSRKGYTFSGWNTAADGSGETYAPNSSITVEENDTLYAVWEINTYTVIYDGNGSDGGNVPEAVDFTYDTEVEVGAAGDLSRTGYSFDRWNTESDPELGEYYNAGETFIMPDSDVTLYACWAVNSYTITYSGNGHTGGSVPDAVTSDYNEPVTTASGSSLVREGYTISGWNTASDGSGANYPLETVFPMGAEDLELFAVWTPNPYTVTFDKNAEDATGEMPPQTIACDVTVHLSVNQFQRDGMAFAGWSSSTDGAIEYTDKAEYTMGTENVILYAQWSTDFHSITFDKNDEDATGEMPPQNVPSSSTVALAANAFEKTDWAFAGWSTTADGEVEYTDEADFEMGTEDVTLYAKWNIVPPAIAFTASSGSGSESVASPAITVTANPIPLSGRTYSVSYTLSGTATGGGTDYTLDNGTLTFTSATFSQTIPLSIAGDAVTEGDETVIITLVDPTGGATLGSPSQFTYTIIDDDRTVAFASASGSGPESGTGPTVTVSLSSALPTGQTGSVQYAVTGGTATGNGTDYTLANGTLIFDASNSSRTVPLTIIDDAINEANETVVITLSSPTNLLLGTVVTYTYTITDNDPVIIAFTTPNGSGSESVASPVITVRANPAPRSGQTFSVNYSVGGTATGGGTDYTLDDGTLTFTSTTPSQTIPFSIISDAAAEADETVIITLVNQTGGAVLGSPSQFTYTIIDDDRTVFFASANGSGLESQTSAAVTVSVSPVPVVGQSYTVNYAATSNGTASNGNDYTLTSGSLTFDAVNLSQTITITIIDEEMVEPDETVVVTLSSPSVGIELGSPSTYTYTILNDDRTVAFESVEGSGLESFAEPTITVSLSAALPNGQTGSVDYAVVSGGTASGDDYTLADGTLNFNDAHDYLAVPLVIEEDGLNEADETVVIRLSNPTNLTLGTNETYTYTIINNDPSVISFTTSSGTGSETGSSQTITVTASPSPGTGLTHSVDLSVSGSAESGSDYLPINGSLSFDAGNTSKTIQLTIVDDPLGEGYETIEINLVNATDGATVGSIPTFTYTIVDDDIGPVAYVSQNANEPYTGASWENAFRYVQDALAAASAPNSPINEIHVATGVYYPDESEANPDGTDDRASTFALVNGVNLLGGYPSGGGIRNPELYVTALNGNIDHEHGNTDPDGNSYHVVTGANCVIDGFTITGGYPDEGSGGEYYGGGLVVNPSLIQTVNNCNFIENNGAWYGSGAYVNGSTVLFENCSFEKNGLTDSYNTYGGGLFINDYNENDATVAINNSSFFNNKAGEAGGAINFWGGSLTIINSVFKGNSARTYGGAIHANGNGLKIIGCNFISNIQTDDIGTYGGGAVSIQGSNNQSIIDKCSFSFNTSAKDGGAISYSSCWGIHRVTNSVFLGDTAENGGAIRLYLAAQEYDPVSIVNCTFSGNTATDTYYGGGAIYSNNSKSEIINCILWNNTASEYPDIYFEPGTIGPAVSNCDIQHGGYGGTNGNISDDPEFCNISPATYRETKIKDTSPCFGRGDPGSAPSDDIDNVERGVTRPPDIGAFEATGSCD